MMVSGQRTEVFEVGMWNAEVGKWKKEADLLPSFPASKLPSLLASKRSEYIGPPAGGIEGRRSKPQTSEQSKRKLRTKRSKPL